MDRRAELRELLALTPDEVIRRAGERLVVCEDLDALHRRFAAAIADEIRARQYPGEALRLILPVGPSGQYRHLAEIVNRERLSLGDVWLFFMDEYCGDDGRPVSADHPLSLQGAARRTFLDLLDSALCPAPERVVFPGEGNIRTLAATIEEGGGIDVCYGGIGIHGHVAFNEPAPGISTTDPRRVRLNDFTITMNAVRAQVGGNLECFPREAYTLGMKQILDARRLRLYCRNGIPLDWANAVLRLALFGEPGDDYPVTHIRGRDYVITTDRATLAKPEVVV